MKVKCPICKSEEFIKGYSVPLTDGEGFKVNANSKTVFVCKCCGYVMMFDGDVDNVHKCYWPDVEDDEEEF